ncbi:MAG: transcription antitermination factor NusB [Deltaproteobacteria bacterium]|nr:transcription antitermination factor NusB [Deltaproteobacteria bacterium]
MRPESRARERAFLCAYAVDMKGSISPDIIKELQKDDSEEVKSFSDMLFTGMSSRIPQIDNIIGRHLKNWTVERLSSVDRSLLRVAVYEMLYYKKTPPKVIFDEYVELAKRYGDTDSGSFVNAVLDAIYKDKD